MNQIWVSGDWHLFNRDPFDKRHPTRTPDEFQTMYDNYVSTIKEGDLFLFLGDLCDAETATDEELDLIKSLLHAIPGYKVMMRGNHDTMDDYFYLMLGFDEICQIGKCHHLVFSHKPCLVGIDEINIHAHLHSEKDHMLNFQHMNVWKWTELNGTPDKPVLLQDLFDLYDKIGNTAEPTWGNPDVYRSKDKLSPWKTLSDYSEKDVLDFSDKFTLAPMDEAVGDRIMEEIIHLNDRLNGFKYGFRSDDGISDEYLSDYRVLSPVKFERARGGVCWDFAVYQADYFRKNFPSVPFTMWYVIFDVGPYWPTHTFMTFRYEGKTYYFESSFKRCAGVWEVESEEDAVNFVMHEMASIDTGVDDLLSHDYYVYRYNALDTRIPGMSAPEFMKHIEKKGHPVKHIYRDDYTVSLYSPVNESADTSDGILDEVLFQDIEQTKRWLADDDTYQDELNAAEYSDSRKPTKMRGKNDVITESSKRKVYKDPTELHKPDRAESNKIAKKYDIPNVGRTTPEEYEEARKSPEERSAERRERQLTQLQRARSVKKRKSIIRKVKSKIPFVKNETVADESDVSDYDSTEHSPLYGDRKHFFYNYDMPKEHNTAAEKLYEMAYEDYCDHFYVRLKSLAAEYNKREDIFKHTAKILKCDQKDLPKFECRVETSSEKQLCFSMVDPDTSFEIKCEYEKYLKEMIKELEKDAKEYPGAKSIWTADAEGTIYVNLELGQLNEAAIKRVSDDGKPVPKTCPKCGAKIGLYLKGETVWLCSNQKCGAYYGTAPMNESAICSAPLYYLSYENLHDDLYPVGKCLFTTIDQAVSEVVWKSKNRHPQNKTHIPCDMFVHVTEPGYYELRSSDQVCGAKWSIDNITLNCIGRIHINADGSYDLDLDRVNESHQNEIVVKAKETTNPNDGESNKAVELTFYLDNQKIGEAGVSGYDTGKGFLYNMEVEKSYRGRGYGKYILNYVMQYYSVTDLSVAVNNDTAIHLYEKAGFRRKKTFRSNGENGYEKGRFHWYQLAETMSESTHASTVDDDHVQGKQYDLRDFTQITVTEEWFRSMKKSYKFLSHIPATKQGVDTIAWMDHNQLVAIVSVDTEPSKRERIWIHNIQVANEYRGHGLSKQILRYVIDKYKTNALAVKSDNLLAHKVYQDIGFIFGSGPDDIMGDSRIMYLNDSTVYHGSPLKLNVLKPQNQSLEARDYVFASPDRNFALCYAGNAWNDFMINQSYLNGKLTLIEIEPDAFEKAFNTTGYLYALDGNDFPIRRSSREVMTDRPVKPKSIKRIPNVYNEIKHSGIQLYHYGTWPKDHIFKSREEYLADRTEKFKHYIQESYQFELVNKTLRFMDPINESVNKTEKLYPVYIMLVHSGTAVSNVIKKVSHSEYSHASISFDSSMSKMYSFARKDPKNPFIGGFRYESIGKGFYEKKEVPYGVYVVPCTEDQIKRMKKRLAYFEKNQEKFTFDFVGLVTNYAGIVNNPAYSWFCSRFVADILNAGSPEGKVYVPEPSLQDPDDFKRAVFARYVTSGNNLMEYNQKEVDRATKRILRAEEMYRKQLNESAYYNRFDPTDPYAVTVMRYQLSNMNEAVMDEFLRYIKSFHVELDPNGNVILTRRVYNQLDHHFIQTKQALKTMKKAGDLEGMKENLAKLYYMIQLITDQYMDKKTVSISKTVKKDMIDLRSVMLNVFQQNLQYVEEMDPKFNFQSYYDGSVYGKKTKIPISGITSIGKTLGTLL